MQVIEKTELFTEVSAEESAIVSGGANFNLNNYLFILGAGVQFGNPGLTPLEIQFAWQSAIEL